MELTNSLDLQLPTSMSNQNFLKAKSAPNKTLQCSLTVSRKFSQLIERMPKWSFQSLVMQDIEEVTDHKTSSERASENNLYKLKSCKEN